VSDAPGDWPLPAHAYVPGQTARHPEGAFDPMRDAAPPVTRSAEAANNAAWRYGLRLFAGGWFWECHEVLEPVWMNAPPNSRERALVQAVIQLANAALKARMGQTRATARLCARARELAAEAAGPERAAVMGVTQGTLRAAIAAVDSGELEAAQGELGKVQYSAYVGRGAGLPPRDSGEFAS
jgi:uncharacterized protein